MYILAGYCALTIDSGAQPVHHPIVPLFTMQGSMTLVLEG